MRAAIREAALASAQVSELAGKQSFCFEPNFIGFAGHFPEYPILPAVLQLLLAQLLAEEVIGTPLVVHSLIRAKFTQQLRPGDQIDVQLRCKEKDGGFHCSTELQVGGQRAASFTLEFNRLS
ncbi:MAG: hypothetical protein J7K90_13845 [Desulfuromusa sp.]|nr:hypothetical protein [Desulfuromusa sp.]